MHYLENQAVPLAALTELYQAVGWSAYTEDQALMEALLPASSYHVAAYEDGKLLGLLRAVTDGVSIVFIQDLLVHPAAQRQGIGTALMRRCVQRYHKVRQIHLCTDQKDEKAQAFYLSLGMLEASTVEMACYTLPLKASLRQVPALER